MDLPIIWGKYRTECLWDIRKLTPDEIKTCEGCSKRKNSPLCETTNEQIQAMNNDGVSCPIKQQWGKKEV